MSKHTPGPWVRKDGNPTFVPLRAHHCEKLGFSVGFVSWDENDGRGEPFANAHLIAAAPELLSFVEEFLRDYQSEDGMYSMKHYAKKARELIAKATGEQQ